MGFHVICGGYRHRPHVLRRGRTGHAVHATAPDAAGVNPGSRKATVWTIFHYGLTGWAMYALMGMALGYMAYRHKRPLAARSALYPIFGDRVNGWLGSVVDAAALLGSVFGLATTLGIGVVQINVGLDILFGVEQGIPAQVSLVALAIVVASISATTGVAKGIRVLSQLNVGLAVALAAWVLFWGRADYLLNALVMNVGDLVAGFPSMTADTMAFNDVSGWMNAWTLFFWAWWVAWASFVGMFLARISRGRTLRQFVLGTLTFPLMYIIMWISIFGNAALDRVINGGEDGNGDTGFANATIDSPELGFFTLIQDYPAATLVVGVATFVALLFFVTSADSGALVMANLTSMLPTPRVDAKAWNRIVWAVISGVLTIGMLVVGGVTALQSATLIMGLPFAIVMLFVMAGLMKALRQDVHRADSLEHSETQRRRWRRRAPLLLGEGPELAGPPHPRLRAGVLQAGHRVPRPGCRTSIAGSGGRNIKERFRSERRSGPRRPRCRRRPAAGNQGLRQAQDHRVRRRQPVRVPNHRSQRTDPCLRRTHACST